MNTQIEILEYTKLNILGTEMYDVVYTLNNDEKTIHETISKNALICWARDSGILEYVHDVVDYDGSHIQQSGTVNVYGWADEIDLFDVIEFLRDKYRVRIGDHSITEVEYKEA